MINQAVQCIATCVIYTAGLNWVLKMYVQNLYYRIYRCEQVHLILKDPKLRSIGDRFKIKIQLDIKWT